MGALDPFEQTTQRFGPIELGAPDASAQQLLVGSSTDVGRVRKRNEDSLYTEPEGSREVRAAGWFGAVADGLGGRPNGHVASRLAVETTRQAFYEQRTGDTAGRLRAAVERANATIYDEAQRVVEYTGMATTITAAVIRDRHLFLAQVGDSRAYRVRDGEIVRLTQDHSWVAEGVRAGLLDPEQARHHPHRNRVTRALGIDEMVAVDCVDERLGPGDIVILCSDGLHGLVEDDEIAGAADGDPQRTAERLVALANDRGGKDNISVVVARLRPTEEVPLAQAPTVKVAPSAELAQAAEVAPSAERVAPLTEADAGGPGRRLTVVALAAVAGLVALSAGWIAFSAGSATPPASRSAAEPARDADPPPTVSAPTVSAPGPLAAATATVAVASQPAATETTPPAIGPTPVNTPSAADSTGAATPATSLAAQPTPGAADPAAAEPPATEPSTEASGSPPGTVTSTTDGPTPEAEDVPIPTARLRLGALATVRAEPRPDAPVFGELSIGDALSRRTLQIFGLRRGAAPAIVGGQPGDGADLWYEIAWPPGSDGRAYIHCSMVELDNAAGRSCNPPASLFPTAN